MIYMYEGKTRQQLESSAKEYNRNFYYNEYTIYKSDRKILTLPTF